MKRVKRQVTVKEDIPTLRMTNKVTHPEWKGCLQIDKVETENKPEN